MDREEAIRILKNTAWLGTVDKLEKVEQAIEKLSETPTRSEKPNNWIPVSKGMPKEYGEYNVTLRDDSIGLYVTTLRFGIADTAYGIREGVFYDPDDERGDVVYEDLIAWQPLPEPYEGEEE